MTQENKLLNLQVSRALRPNLQPVKVRKPFSSDTLLLNWINIKTSGCRFALYFVKTLKEKNNSLGLYTYISAEPESPILGISVALGFYLKINLTLNLERPVEFNIPTFTKLNGCLPIFT